MVLQQYVYGTMNPASDSLQYNMVGRWNDNMIVPPSDGPMLIVIDWEYVIH